MIRAVDPAPLQGTEDTSAAPVAEGAPPVSLWRDSALLAPVLSFAQTPVISCARAAGRAHCAPYMTSGYSAEVTELPPGASAQSGTVGS